MFNKNPWRLSIFIFSLVTGFWIMVGSGPASASSSQVLTPERITMEARKFLFKKLPWKEEDLEVTIRYEGGKVKLPRGRLQLDFKMPRQTARAGRVPISLKVRVNGVFVRGIRMRADVFVAHDVVRTTHAIRRGEIIENEDVVVERVSTDRPLQRVAKTLEEVVGFEAARNLRAGQPIRSGSLRIPTLLRKGDRVVIVARKGLLKITSPGIAKEKGVKGSLVAVTNLQSKKTVYARVQDANTVEVQF